MTLDEGIKTLLRDGGDPRDFRRALARRFGIDPAQVDAAIERIGGVPRAIEGEALAQQRLADEARERRLDPQAARAWDHEEE